MWKIGAAFIAGAATASAILLTRERPASTHATAAMTPANPIATQSTHAWGSSPFAPATSNVAKIEAAPAISANVIAPMPNAPAMNAATTEATSVPAIEEKPHRNRRGDRRDVDLLDANLPDPIVDLIARDRLHPDSISQLHDDFNAQGSRSDWAAGAEQSIKDYLAPTVAAHGISITSVSCRETLCEVQALGPATGTGIAWGDAMRDFGRGGYGVGPGRWNMDTQNGQTYVLSYFWRPKSR